MLKNQKFVNNCHCSDNGIRELSLFTGVGEKRGFMYDKIIKLIEQTPMTYVPAVLKKLIKIGIGKKVFKKGTIHVFVKQIEDGCKEFNA